MPIYPQTLIRFFATAQSNHTKNLLTGAASQLGPADDTTEPSYWLNWRFFLCVLWIFIAMILAAILIIKYEIFIKKKTQNINDEDDVEPVGMLYEDETWKTSLKSFHPAWLLVYRLVAFGVMLALIIANLIVYAVNSLFFYTQWTFALVTFYFALASSHSVYVCYKYRNEVGDDNINNAILDQEQSNPVNPPNNGLSHGKTAGVGGYFFQIVFQICAGAVGLTDSVFWFIIYPFLTPADYTLHFFDISMHSVNAILLLVDIVLNRLRFPFFCLAYFGLWTCTFVIFQWIYHVWPYPFLDLSSPYAPIWYLGVGLIHLPAYGIFALVIRGKQLFLSRFS